MVIVLTPLVRCAGELFGGVALCACSLKLYSLLLFVYVEGIDYENITTVLMYYEALLCLSVCCSCISSCCWLYGQKLCKNRAIVR